MSNTCTVPLYSRNQSLDFIGKVIKESTIENVVENVASFLKKEASFATTLLVAEDQEKYEDNIVGKLIPDLVNEIQRGLKIRFSPIMLSKIQKDLYNQFIQSNENVVEQEEHTTDTREEKSNKNKGSRTLRQTRNNLFKGSKMLSDYHMKEFSREIRNHIIFNNTKGQRTLVYDEKTLNENLRQYKQNLYEIIYEYCKKVNLPISNRRSYYNSFDYSVSSKAKEILELFYKYLNEMNIDDRISLLEKDWKDLQLSISKDINLLQAVNAYITLIHFDDLIKSSVGNYIQFDKNLEEPVNIIEHNGRNDTKYKYSFGRKQTNMQKDFRDVIQNALETMGNFSKFLIESIPKLGTTETLTQIQFINALLHLKNAIKALPDTELNSKYKNPLKSIHRNPKENWRKILNEFANQKNYNAFYKVGLTTEDINIINSIQRYIYGKYSEEKKKSLYTLENEVHNLTGYKEVYSLVDTLLGTIDSISEINYLETTWDYTNNQPIVQVKRKYFTNKQKLDLISGINQEASLPLSEKIKEDYKISYLGGPFKCKIGELNISIQPKKSSEFGIFDNDLEVTINGQSVKEYFKEIDLSGTKERNDILQAEKGIKSQFLEVLKYIDTVLTTGLGINNESLQKYFIYDTKSQHNGLEDLIVAASRVYLVKDIKRKFQNSINRKEINKVTEKPYNLRDLHDWMKDHPSLIPIRQFLQEKNRDNRKYFGELLGIPYLKPVQYQETWIDILGEAQAVLTGESLKAVTKNFDGENVPNYSPAFLGADIHEILERNNENPTTSNLLFSIKQSAIKNVIIDTDVRLPNGKTKQVKNMTEAELQYHFFVNKFLIPFMKTKKNSHRLFYSQPIVYSDKSKFVGYEISLDDLDINLKDNNKIIEGIQDSLGKYFKRILENILTDYSKLFNFIEQRKTINTFIELNRRQPTIKETENLINNAEKITPTIESIQNELKNRTLKQLMNEIVLYNDTHDDKIELKEQLHYRTVNGKLGLNEILVYRNDYMQNLPKIMREESLNYVNTLLSSGVIFDTNTGIKEALIEMNDEFKLNINDWIDSNGVLILAKQVTPEGVINIIGGQPVDTSQNIIINPLIEKYVLIHNLVNNNLKEAVFGTDAVHKIKPKPAKLSIEDKINLGFEVTETPDLVGSLVRVNKLIKEVYKGITPDPTEEELLQVEEITKSLNRIKDKITNQIRVLENAADIAQLKRTVAGPGTMRYFLQGTLTGILPTLRCAIIQDVKASVFNFEGESNDGLDAHDGGAWLNPITAVFQNNSLQDSEVGDVIKPLWQADSLKYGSKNLVKYAADTMTNSIMKNSELSEISMYHMFKKMTSIRWNGEYQSNSKNLFNQYSHRQKNKNVQFSDITQNSGSLYYSIGNRIFQIVGIGFENGAYYTEEQEVQILKSNGSVATIKDSDVVYFHYFDDDGNHYKIKEGDPIPKELHTIDSVYELHKVFGGVYSQSLKDGQFVTSDASIKATAAVLNMVSEPTQRCLEALQKKEEIEDIQEFYYQPLKYKMVDYLINQSAIKNGTGNINFSDVYYNPNNDLNDVQNEESLRYIELDTYRYGIQQDSEHEADDEELTEMSQVISAIDAGGHYHKEVAELYSAIGHLALSASKMELDKIKLFQETKNQNILYDLIGRTLIEHLSLNRGQNGIVESIMDRVKKYFNTSTDHTFDELKIPFSDQTIYNQIVSTIASILNKKSVKRKFPGTGQVMAPGYNIVQIWNIDGNYAKYEDLIKEAEQAGFKSESVVPEQYNKEIVQQYLKDRQTKYAQRFTKTIPLKLDGTDYDSDFWEGQLQSLNPIDIVQCTVDGRVLKPIKLDKIKDYYQFKNNPIQYLRDKGLISETPKELQVVKRIDIPSNLAPLQYRFFYTDETGINRIKNIYDVQAVKDMYFKLEEFKQSLESLELSDYEKNKRIELEKIRLRNIEQEVLNKIDKGIYVDRNGKEYTITKSENKPAQTLMSNIFRTKFGLNPGESLYDVLKQGSERFIKSPLKLLPNEGIYDLALLKSDGTGMLISFNNDELSSVDGFYKVKNKEFKNITEHEIVDGKDLQTKNHVISKTLNGDTIHSYIYYLDSNNMEVVPIGIKIDVSNKIEFNGTDYVYKDTKKKVTENLELTRKGNKVLQTIQFVSKQSISPRHSKKYTVYNIKEKLLQELLGDQYISQIISNLYAQDTYTYIMPNKYINAKNKNIIKQSIDTIRKNSGDPDIRDYLNKFLGVIEHIDVEDGMSQVKGFNNIFKEYNKKLAEKVFNSFKESLYFISSRIPAQSLQSFMKMQVVGFTNSEANVAYVSHWQTWLQGSDYKLYLIKLYFNYM